MGAPVSTCPRCHAPLPAGASGRVCPACLLSLALVDEDEAPVDDTVEIEKAGAAGGAAPSGRSERERSIFADALARPPAERPAFLARACGGDADLRDRVEARLRACENPRGPREPSGDAPGATGAHSVAPRNTALEHVPGALIGRYKLLEQIGEGGFGVVWMAEQREPVRRRVALKILKPGVDTREVIARFEAERQALALMDHPNIAHVFDGGATDSGRPYFVMELVRGIPLTRYCDEHKVAPRDRLRLFIKVCQAVQHAHQKGIIHRDLKPSNILVTLHDGVPVPKIIDFGIAKATSRELTEKTLFTQFRAFLGTPAYTSPEQMEMSGLDIDTRSDIYSLGVLLYELLAGRPPFDPEALAKSGLEAMRRTIREVDPPRPSSRLGTLSEVDRTTVARQRGTDPARLSLLLRGDLDWIVMHCLEKDRTRRYETANGLAMDVERHLRNEPIAARPPSRAYRTQKFIRRHKVGVLAGAAIALSVIAGLVASSLLLVRERAAHEREVATRDRAVAAEAAESRLRRQAEAARAAEAKRSARTSVALATQLLEKGDTADALAYMVHAARTDPEDPVIAPQLLSALTSRNFLLPAGAPLDLPSPARAARRSADGRHIFVLGEDGVVRVMDVESWEVSREFRFEAPVVGPWTGGVALAEGDPSLFAVRLANHSLLVCDAVTGRPRIPPIRPEGGFVSGDYGLSPDGRWVAAHVGDDLWLWDTTTGERRAMLPNTGMYGVQYVAFSPDSSRIATTDRGDVIRLWSVPDGQPVGVPIEPGDKNFAGGKVFSPDGRQLAVSCHEAIQIYDAANGDRLGPVLPTVGGRIGSPDFSPDERHLVVDGLREMPVFDASTLQPAFAPLVHGNDAWVSGFSDDGKTLLTTSDDGLVRVWDMDTGKLLAEPALQQDRWMPAVLSPDGREVVACTTAGPAYRLRARRTAARPLALAHGGSLAHAMFLPQPPARLLWFMRDGAKVIDVATGRETEGGFRYPVPIAEGSWIFVRPDVRAIVAKTEDKEWQAWLLGDSGVRQVVPLEGVQPDDSGMFWAEFSPVGDLVAIAVSGKRKLEVRSLLTGKNVAPPFEPQEFIHFISPVFSPDGRRVVLTFVDSGTAAVWDFTHGKEPLGMKIGDRGAWWRGTTFTPDGAHVLVGCTDGTVVLCRADTGAFVQATSGHRSNAGVAAFSPDSRRFVTRGYDATTRVWDAGAMTPLGEPMVVPGNAPRVAFSPDGDRVATGAIGGEARVWDARTGRPLSEPLTHDFPVWEVEFSPDGRFLLTANAASGQPQRRTDGFHHVWAAPPFVGEGPAPEWLLRLATICAAKRVTEDGRLVDASEAFAGLEDLRRELAALPATPYVEWGRWFLADPATRPIAPGFAMTTAEAERFERAIAAGQRGN